MNVLAVFEAGLWPVMALKPPHRPEIVSLIISIFLPYMLSINYMDVQCLDM